MDGLAPWASGAAMALLALFGLGVASRAVDAPFHLFGMALFVFGVACVFGLILRHTRGGRPAAAVGDAERPPQTAAISSSA